MKTLAVTGHRPKDLGNIVSPNGYSDVNFKMLVLLARDALVELKPDYLITGMAQGWDQACAYAANMLGIPFTAAVPCVGQDSEWPDHAKALYHDLLACATRIYMVDSKSKKFSITALHKRNEWCVNESTEVLALYDKRKLYGGTFNCVKYADNVGKPIVHRWDTWQRYLAKVAAKGPMTPERIAKLNAMIPPLVPLLKVEDDGFDVTTDFDAVELDDEDARRVYEVEQQLTEAEQAENELF